MVGLKQVPNILAVRCDDNEVVINNISNPMRIDEFNEQELFERDMFLILKCVEAIWDNRPEYITDEQESFWYRKIGKTFTYINEN